MTHASEPIGDIRDGPFLRERYPGLREQESDLLRVYLLETGTESIERLRTQTEIGPGEDIVHFEPRFREMAFRLSRWKIDAIVDYPGRTDLIELKSRANHTAMGQTLGYRHYFAQVHDERSTPRLLIVAYRETPAIRAAATAEGVEVHLVPTADPTTASRAHGIAESLDDLRETRDA